MAIGETIRNSQIWKSIFRHPMPLDRRNRIVVMLTNFFLHLHPVSIKKQGIALSFTWCMGGVTFFLFLVETVTGVLLMFYYRPTLEWAYNDILALTGCYEPWHPSGIAQVGCACNGHHNMASHVPCFSDRQLQASERIQLGDWSHSAFTHTVVVFHRVFASLGSACNLGNHGRFEHGKSHANFRV